MEPTSKLAAPGTKVVYLSEAPSPSIGGYELFSDYPDLLTPAHIAEITGQCEATARAMCSRAELPAVRIGKRWYVPKPSMVKLVLGGLDGR
ncbi:MAG: helix-turn-helix domain-containing protein [Eggerthellaceae bacterium]|nr:helix-turn-helix domain-containing protein [Eggerthellaceae bacterium]